MVSPHVYDRSKDSKNFGHTSGLGSRHDQHKADETGKPVKGITTEDNAFVKDSQTVAKIFYKFPWIVNALEAQRMHFISQVPNNFDSLVKVKGIGKRSAMRILEAL